MKCSTVQYSAVQCSQERYNYDILLGYVVTALVKFWCIFVVVTQHVIFDLNVCVCVCVLSVIRKYQPNKYTSLWFTAFQWGVIFMHNQVHILAVEVVTIVVVTIVFIVVIVVVIVVVVNRPLPYSKATRFNCFPYNRKHDRKYES